MSITWLLCIVEGVVLRWREVLAAVLVIANPCDPDQVDVSAPIGRFDVGAFDKKGLVLGVVSAVWASRALGAYDYYMLV